MDRRLGAARSEDPDAAQPRTTLALVGTSQLIEDVDDARNVARDG